MSTIYAGLFDVWLASWRYLVAFDIHRVVNSAEAAARDER
jgi:hypothetical protein